MSLMVYVPTRRCWTSSAKKIIGPGQQRERSGSLTRQLVQQTIAEMDLDPVALAEVEEAFIGAGLL